MSTKPLHAPKVKANSIQTIRCRRAFSYRLRLTVHLEIAFRISIDLCPGKDFPTYISSGNALKEKIPRSAAAV
jgi:hypothetical protein